jgi:hypothetical protein
MVDSSPGQIVEQLVASLEEMLVAIGRGIGQAQAALDRSSIQIQQEIDADPLLAQHGVRATWYQLPRTEVELRVGVSFEGTAPGPTIPQVLAPSRMLIHPVNARYQNLFNFDATATSSVKLTIVPVPPQVSANPATRTEEDVNRLATPLLEHEPGSTDLRKDSRLITTFNAGTRTWTVLQVTGSGAQTVTIATVDVDDASGAATRR